MFGWPLDWLSPLKMRMGKFGLPEVVSDVAGAGKSLEVIGRSCSVDAPQKFGVEIRLQIATLGPLPRQNSEP